MMNGEYCAHGREEERVQGYMEAEKKLLVRYNRKW